jgi:hypothetical protein
MAMPYNLRIKKFSHSKDLIFSNKNPSQSIDALENANFINGFDLFTYFPAKYLDRNKKALLDDILHKKKYTPADRDVLIARFHPKQLPINYTYEQHTNISKTHTFIPNVFDYKSTDETNVIEWHMNFANCDIFAYYNSGLLAQDELQVLECPQLASLREYLVQQSYSENTGDEFFNTRVTENNLPYPILISNIEHVVDLNTTNLYGKN